MNKMSDQQKKWAPREQKVEQRWPTRSAVLAPNNSSSLTLTIINLLSFFTECFFNPDVPAHHCHCIELQKPPK